MITKVANTDSEWRQAFHLLKLRFEENDLIPKSDKQYYLRSYDSLADTTLFVAKENNEVIGTTTLVWDNQYLGLPLDSVYRKEIDVFRHREYRLAEGGMIATKPDLGYKESLTSLLAVTKLLIAYFFYHEGHTLVVGAHPKHNKFYQKKLGFNLLGSETIYPDRNNKPVQAYYLNKYTMSVIVPEVYKEIHVLPLTTDLTPSIIPLELLDELRSG